MRKREDASARVMMCCGVCVCCVLMEVSCAEAVQDRAVAQLMLLCKYVLVYVFKVEGEL